MSDGKTIATLIRTLVTGLAATSAFGCTSSSPSDAHRHTPVTADAGKDSAVPFPPPEPDDCFPIGDAGPHAYHCEGLDFQISVPDVCLTKPCGLIADLHGFGMNAILMDFHTHMRDRAGAKGYIVLQPSAPGGVLSSAWSPANDAQVFAIMQRVINVWHVDPKRIHFDGYSMGGWMTWRFICAHSDILASAAPLAGGLQPNSSCPFTGQEGVGIPARQIPILYTHGRNDGFVSFSQAAAERDAVVAAWYPGVTPEVVKQESDYEWDRYTNDSGNVFEFIQHDWACDFVLPLGASMIALKGHCFPGSKEFLGCGRDTNGAADGGIVYPIDWAETVLQFFIDHPKTD